MQLIFSLELWKVISPALKPFLGCCDIFVLFENICCGC